MTDSQDEWEQLGKLLPVIPIQTNNQNAQDIEPDLHRHNDFEYEEETIKKKSKHEKSKHKKHHKKQEKHKKHKKNKIHKERNREESLVPYLPHDIIDKRNTSLTIKDDKEFDVKKLNTNTFIYKISAGRDLLDFSIMPFGDTQLRDYERQRTQQISQYHRIDYNIILGLRSSNVTQEILDELNVPLGVKRKKNKKINSEFANRYYQKSKSFFNDTEVIFIGPNTSASNVEINPKPEIISLNQSSRENKVHSLKLNYTDRVKDIITKLEKAPSNRDYVIEYLNLQDNLGSLGTDSKNRIKERKIEIIEKYSREHQQISNDLYFLITRILLIKQLFHSCNFEKQCNQIFEEAMNTIKDPSLWIMYCEFAAQNLHKDYQKMKIFFDSLCEKHKQKIAQSTSSFEVHELRNIQLSICSFIASYDYAAGYYERGAAYFLFPLENSLRQLKKKLFFQKRSTLQLEFEKNWDDGEDLLFWKNQPSSFYQECNTDIEMDDYYESVSWLPGNLSTMEWIIDVNPQAYILTEEIIQRDVFPTCVERWIEYFDEFLYFCELPSFFNRTNSIFDSAYKHVFDKNVFSLKKSSIYDMSCLLNFESKTHKKQTKLIVIQNYLVEFKKLNFLEKHCNFYLKNVELALLGAEVMNLNEYEGLSKSYVFSCELMQRELDANNLTGYIIDFLEKIACFNLKERGFDHFDVSCDLHILRLSSIFAEIQEKYYKSLTQNGKKYTGFDYIEHKIIGAPKACNIFKIILIFCIHLKIINFDWIMQNLTGYVELLMKIKLNGEGFKKEYKKKLIYSTFWKVSTLNFIEDTSKILIKYNVFSSDNAYNESMSTLLKNLQYECGPFFLRYYVQSLCIDKLRFERVLTIKKSLNFQKLPAFLMAHYLIFYQDENENVKILLNEYKNEDSFTGIQNLFQSNIYSNSKDLVRSELSYWIILKRQCLDYYYVVNDKEGKNFALSLCNEYAGMKIFYKDYLKKETDFNLKQTLVKIIQEKEIKFIQKK